MKIEIGARYVIVNSRAGNNGVEVVALCLDTTSHLAKLTATIHPDDTLYCIDKLLINGWGEPIDRALASQLKKIDDQGEAGSFEAIKDIWQPKLTKEHEYATN